MTGILKALAEHFPEAVPIRSVYQAADQDGYDGGWIEYDCETGSVRWAETKEQLKTECLKPLKS